MTTTPKPAPRVDENGVPWCTQMACPCAVPKEPATHPWPGATLAGTPAHCSITGGCFFGDEPCLPAIREMAAELVRLRVTSAASGSRQPPG